MMDNRRTWEAIEDLEVAWHDCCFFTYHHVHGHGWLALACQGGWRYDTNSGADVV